MSLIDTFAVSPLVHAVGMSLLNFLWQGTLIAVLTALLLVTVRRASAQARYVVACVGLAMMFVTPMVTVARSMGERSAITSGSASSTSAAPTSPAGDARALQTFTAPQSPVTRAWIESQLPFVVLVWSAGVLLLALDLVRGWLRVRTLRRTAKAFEAPDWIESVGVLAARLGITTQVRLLQSRLVEVPAVIGWLRPAIIVPVSAVAGLSPAQLELILAHELAHIRRSDYLINVLQRVVETLLFYHPAVWWVSRQIRIEREHCCDDLAVSLGADRVAYAGALASLEELRAATPTLAMGARGGELVNRVRRLVAPGLVAGPRWSGGIAMGVVIAVVLLAVSPYGMSRIGAAEPARVSPEPVERTIVQPPAPTVPVTPALTRSARATQRAATNTTLQTQSQTQQPPRDPVPPAQPTSVSGVVTDEHGGVIPGATVTAWSVSTADRRSIVTNSAGRYAISGLPADAYDLTVTLQGLKASRNRIQLVSGKETIANIRLQLGSLSETITVSGTRTMISSSGAPVTTAAPPPPPPGGPGRLSTAAEYFDAAKSYAAQGKAAEADQALMRARELLREIAENALVSTTAYDTSKPIRVGGSIREPKIIRRVEPVYPAAAQADQIQGYVIIEAIIATDGTVKDAKAIKSHPLLDDAALEAVRRWQYTPTTLNGVPIEVAMSVTVIFSLK